MKVFTTVLHIIFAAIMFIYAAALFVSKDYFAGLLALGFSISIIPPVQEFIFKTIKMDHSNWFGYIAFFLGLIVPAVFSVSFGKAQGKPMINIVQKEPDKSKEKEKQIEKLEDEIELREESTFTGTMIVNSVLNEDEKAIELYKSKRIYVTGMVKSIKNGLSGEKYVNLQTENKLFIVMCYLENIEDAKKVKVGSFITFRGAFVGMVVYPKFEYCTIETELSELRKQLKELKR